MSDADTTPATTSTAAADGHGSGDDHDSPAEPLGAPDRTAWAAAIGGGAIGLLVAAALFAASQG